MKSLGLNVLTLATGGFALAACSAEPQYPIEMGQPMGQGGVDVAQPRYPIASDRSPPPQPAPHPAARTYDDDAPRAAPSATIDTRPLGAPGTAPSSAYSAPPPPPPPPSSRPYPPEPSSAQSDADADLRGRQSVGPPPPRPLPMPALEVPHEVQVQPFETVYDVAERVRTPIRAIVELNGLRPPYTLTPGMMLRIPPPVVYTVAEGDNLFGVSRRFSIDPRSLANLNDIPLETRLKAGQRLALPSLVQDRGPNPKARGGRPEGLAAASAVAVATAAARIPYKSAGASAAAPYAAGAATAAGEHAAADLPAARPEVAPVSDAQVVALGKGKFAWPVKGEILSSFGPKGAGQRNDGVNIAASNGDSVKAAASGVVVYAGNSIPAFGNLVLVKHPNGWASLYGNLGKISVKNNAAVAQGQEIGTAGVSGAVDRPQVHFEIRYTQNPRDKAKPYDPAGLLP